MILPRLICACWLAVTASLAPGQTPDVTVSRGGSNPFGPPAESVATLVPVRVIDVAAELEAFLEANDSMLGHVKPADMTGAAALQSLRALYAAGDARALLDAATKAPELRGPNAPSSAALGLFARGRAGEAVLCLLLAVDRSPQDPRAWLNLAGGALVLGRANEALACVQSAERLGALPSAAWGISGAHWAGYLRGYAFLQRGEYARARSALLPVSEAEPSFREATLALALAQAKLGEEPRPAFLRGSVRTRARMVVRDRETPETLEEARRVPDGLTEGDAVAPSLSDLFDLSRGRPGRLPEVQRPADAEELMGLLEPQMTRFAAAQQEAVRQQNEVIAAALRAFEAADLAPQYRRRQIDLFNAAVTRKGTEADLDAAAYTTDFLRDQLDRATEDAIQRSMDNQMPIRMRQAEEDQGKQMTKERLLRNLRELNGPADQALGVLAPRLAEYHLAADREFELRSSVMHGMLAYIGEPSLRTALKAAVEQAQLELEAQKISAVANLSGLLGATFDADALEAEIEEGEDGDGPPCDEQAARVSVSLELGPVGVEMNCSSVSLELESKLIPGFFSVSGELGFDIKGEVSAFIGPKETMPGVGSMKQGIYLTAGEDGVRDIGVKNETKVVRGVGPINVNYKGDDSVISFMPKPDSGAAAVGDL